METQIKLGRAVASWIFPLVGVITYFSRQDDAPVKAKKYLTIAGISFGIYILIGNLSLIVNLAKCEKSLRTKLKGGKPILTKRQIK